MTAMLLLATSSIVLPSRRCVVQAFCSSSATVALSRRLYSTNDSSSSIPDNNAYPLSKFTGPSFSNFQLAPTPSDRIDLAKDQRLVCIGDVHGDYYALTDFLEIANVYDGKKWIGGNTIVVQCGDVLDRGSQELNCWNLLSKLSHEATASGGNVIALYGNHEALNAAGLFQYTTGDEEYEEYVGKIMDEVMEGNDRWRLQFGGNQPSRWSCYEPGGLLAEPLLQNLKVAVQVGKTVCVHAGLKQSHLDEMGGIEGMNAKAKDWIQQVHHDQNNNMGIYQTVEEIIADAQTRAKSVSQTMPSCLGGGIGATSPVWMRDYSSPPNGEPNNYETALANISTVLDTLSADRLVMGHTVQRQINSALENKAWRIDVGASRGVSSGTPEVLQVLNNGNEEVVSILTKSGQVIPANERSVGAENLARFL